MATIQGVYLALFGRPADPSGLTYFNSVTANGANLAGIADLSKTNEYLGRFAGQATEQIINTIFLSLFGRTGDPAGVAFFVGELASGRQTINTIAINILDGAQGADKTLVDKKLAASALFTAAIDTPAEIASYNGTTNPSSLTKAVAFLTGITATSPTITQADADAAALSLGGGVASTALTTGIDNFIGTSGDDIYTATSTTLNATDVIDGAGGKDKIAFKATGNADVGSPTLKSVETIEIFGTGNTSISLNNATGLSSIKDTSVGDLNVILAPTGIVYEIGVGKAGKLGFGFGPATIDVKLAGEAGKGAGVSEVFHTTAGVVAGTINVVSEGTGAVNQLGLVRGNTTKINISSDASSTSSVSLTAESGPMTVDASGMQSAGILYTGSSAVDNVLGGKGVNYIATGKGVDDITITNSSAVSDKISFEGITLNADLNIVRGFVAGGGGDVISILASDTSAGTSASNPPVIQTVASKAAFTSFDTTVNDILELEFAIDSSGGAVTALLAAIGTTGLGGDGIRGTAGGSGYIVAYSMANEALLFHVQDTIASASPVFQIGEIEFVGILTNVSMGSLTSANFDLIP
jgi:hypothetical protein